MAKYDLIGLGNALVDSEFHVTDSFLKKNGFEKGTMHLVDNDEQTNLLNSLEKEYGKPSLACGGSATNTIFAASILGSSCSYICKVGNDKNGNFYLNDLSDAGVNIDHSIMLDSEIGSGTCTVMVSPDAERTMSTCLGISSDLSASDVAEEIFSDSKLIYLEGYMMSGDDSYDACLEAIKLAKKKNVKIAFTLSDPNIVLAFKEKMLNILNSKVDVLFCNDEEAKVITDLENSEQALKKLGEYSDKVFVTLGSKGAMILENGDIEYVSGYEVDPIDTNGAGDMFAGAVLNRLLLGNSNKDAASFGCFLASRGVTVFGPRLERDEYLKYQKEFNSL